MIASIIGNVSDALVLIVLFGVTIFVHELGHFITALKMGMAIETFSIGFGPALLKKRIRGVTYKLGCIPVGGYVSLPQLDPAGMQTLQGREGGEAVALPPIQPWKKIVVSFAGAGGNLLLAVGLAWIIYFAPDGGSGDTGTRIGHVAANSPAAAAGLRAGDVITAVNGKTVATWHDVGVECLLGAGDSNRVVLTVAAADGARNVELPTAENEMGVQTLTGLHKSTLCVVQEVADGGSAAAAGVRAHDVVETFGGTPVASTEHFIRLVDAARERPTELVVERAGELVALTVTPRYDEEVDRALIGVVVRAAERGVMPWMQHRRPWRQIKGDAMGIVRILKALVTPRESKQAAKGLGGPIMIFATLWLSIQSSILNAVGFLRFLNVNLAILNLLPIPVLDGGHIVFALWEGVTRRRAHPKLVSLLINLFAVLLIGALLLITYRDFLRLFRLRGTDNGAGARPAATAAPAPNPAAPEE